MPSIDQLAAIGFEQAPIALCITRQRILVCCNHAFAALFGYTANELAGHTIALLYPSNQEYRRIGQRGYPRMKQGRRYQDERLMRRSDGELIWCRVSGAATDPVEPAREAVWSFEKIAHSAKSTTLLSPREREV